MRAKVTIAMSEQEKSRGCGKAAALIWIGTDVICFVLLECLLCVIYCYYLVHVVTITLIGKRILGARGDYNIDREEDLRRRAIHVCVYFVICITQCCGKGSH